MAIEPIPVIRAIYLNLVLDVLGQSGKNAWACLPQFNLPPTTENSPNAYLPLNSVLSFVPCAVGGTELDAFILRTGNRLKVTDFSVDLRSAVRLSPSLDSALQSLCELADREQSTARYRILPGGEAVRIQSSFGDDSTSVASYFGEWLRIMTVSRLVRRFVGDTWTPSEIALQSPCEPGEDLRRAFPRTRFLTGQAATSVTLSSKLLHLTHAGDQGRFRPLGTAGRRYAAAPGPGTWDFVTSLREILKSYLADGYPDINLAAGIVGCSVRTLQRRLKNCGQSFSDVVQQARFETAAQLLREPDTQVIDATYAVGYSDPSHFARAFRRVAGVSPRQYQVINRVQ